jgi:hypothetical protein
MLGSNKFGKFRLAARRNLRQESRLPFESGKISTGVSMTLYRFQAIFKLRWLLAFCISGCVHITGPVVLTPQLDNAAGNAAEAAHEGIEEPGMVVHIDPKTGKIVVPPAAAAPGELPLPPVDAAKKPPEELREMLSPVPGGGVIIELDDRFQTPLSATIDAGGKVRFEHKPTMCSPDDNK